MKLYDLGLIIIGIIVLAGSSTVLIGSIIDQNKDNITYNNIIYNKTNLNEEELSSSNYQECIEQNNIFYCY